MVLFGQNPLNLPFAEIMIVVYRKRKDGLVWHFHTQCSQWPESDYIQMRFLDLAEDERMCDECAKLEATIVPEKLEIPY